MMMASILKILHHSDILDDYKTLVAYRDRCFDRQAYQRAIADQCADIAPFERAIEMASEKLAPGMVRVVSEPRLW